MTNYRQNPSADASIWGHEEALNGLMKMMGEGVDSMVLTLAMSLLMMLDSASHQNTKRGII